MALVTSFTKFTGQDTTAHEMQDFVCQERLVRGRLIATEWCIVVLTGDSVYWLRGLSAGLRDIVMELSESGGLISMLDSGEIKLVRKHLVVIDRSTVRAISPIGDSATIVITDSGEQQLLTMIATSAVSSALANALLPGHEFVEDVPFDSRGWLSKEVKTRGATCNLYRMPGADVTRCP